MNVKHKIFALFTIITFLDCSFIIPSILHNQLNSYNNDFSFNSQNIIFDDTIFDKKNNRIIINYIKGSNLKYEEQKLLSLCNTITDPILFDYISTIVCEVDKIDISKIASISSVRNIYIDEKISIDRSNIQKDISFEEIFQLNQCATTINSRSIPFTGNGINISIIDTGIDFTHSDLSGKMLDQVSFVTTSYGFDADKAEDEMDYDGHGTHCAGIATGTGSASPVGYNLTGIAPQAKLLNAKCLDQFGSGYLSGVLAAIEWSIDHKASIISMSLGFDTSDPDHPICRAVDNATRQGIVVVASAGNSGPFFSTPGSPASARTIITVGASDKNNSITDFSSRGPTSLGYIDPDVVAPGRNIISPAAKNSLLGKIQQLNNNYVYGTAQNNYMILDGTSMSCPMVAGAAALLLEAFPNLNPYMVRIALMKGAVSIGYSPNVEGTGLIDVNNSYNYLLNSNPDFNVSIVLPGSIPNPPFDFSMFPGDQYIDDIVILSGNNINMSVKCTGNISSYVSIEGTSDNEMSINNSFLYIKDNNSQFTNLNLNINFPLSIQHGLYDGKIEIRNNDTNQIIETVNLSFSMVSPRGRIYFDCFHNSDSADHQRSNYYNFTKLLFNKSIDVDFKRSLISFPILSQYDLLILPDIETPFTEYELMAIKKYWNYGNNILIIGSYYPSTAIEPINELLSILNVGINFTKINIESSYDVGLSKYYEDFLITDIKSHPITENVSQFSWLTGVQLEINISKATSIANYNDQSVIAVYNQSNYKEIVCMGSERIFYDDFISKSYNQKLVIQTIQWLLNDSSRSQSENLSVEVIVNRSIMELGNNNMTEIGFYISDPDTGNTIDNLIPHSNLSCNVMYYNSGIWNSVWIANISDIVNTGNGGYYFNFTTDFEGLFMVNISIRNLSGIGNGLGISFFNTTISMPKIIDYSLTTTNLETQEDYDDETSNDIYRNVDSVILNITLHDDDLINDIQNITVYITSLDTYRKNIKYVQMEMINLTTKDSVEANFSIVISPDYTYPAGLYVIFIEVIDSKGYSDFSSVILDFYINDKYPDISAYGSKLNGMSFNSISGLPMTLLHGIDFNLQITGSDTENTLSQMSAYVAIFSYFSIGLYSYLYELLWGTEIPFTGSLFSGSVSIPTSGTSQILDESYSLSGSYILIILLLDGDGQYDDESYTYTLVLVQSPIIFSFIIIITIIIVVGIVSYLLLYYYNKKKSKTSKNRICRKCGATILETQKYCPNCGDHDSTKLDFE